MALSAATAALPDGSSVRLKSRLAREVARLSLLSLRMASPRWVHQFLQIPDLMLLGGGDEGVEPAPVVEHDDTELGIGLYCRLVEEGLGLLFEADGLEMPEGIAQPVDGGHHAQQRLGAFCRRQQHDRVEQNRGTALDRHVGLEPVALERAD